MSGADARDAELVVVFAECEHGSGVRNVAVHQARGTWSVEVTYGCASECTDRDVLENMPGAVVDTTSRVHWAAP